MNLHRWYRVTGWAAIVLILLMCFSVSIIVYEVKKGGHIDDFSKNITIIHVALLSLNLSSYAVMAKRL